MSLVYYSIVTAVRLGRNNDEIVSEIASQCVDDPIQMVKILTSDMAALIRLVGLETELDLTKLSRYESGS